MKKHRNLYRQVWDFENLYQAYRKTRRGKRRKRQVCEFEFDLENNLLRLRDELRDQAYQPGPYTHFYITEPKRRRISAAQFRDRVAHQALVRVVEPLFERQFIHDSYACRVDKGTHRALDRAQHFARGHRYVLPVDVRQYFPSIDHEILRGLLRRVIGDEQVLWFCDVVLDSFSGENEGYDMVYFPGDDPSTGSGQGLFAANRPRGLPIGNVTSQFWANVFLNEVDQFAKRELKVRAYLRYCDDMLLFADDKATLWAWKDALRERLASLRLTMHERRALPIPVAAGIPWLGWRVYPTHHRLKRENLVRFARRLRRLHAGYQCGDVSRERLDRSVQGWVAHAAHGQTWRLRESLFAGVIL